MLILGLDVGPTSLGWALVDETNRTVIDDGVRIFPEGVDRDQQGGEQSKSQARREARGLRRQIRRRARRKRIVREALQSIRLLPASADELHLLVSGPSVKTPYQLRADAVKQKLEPHELGRVFLHLATRRGFLSNRKTDKRGDAKGMLEEIGELNETLTKRSELLGQYLYYLDKSFDHRSSRDQDRVRHRHTRRAMFEAEFDAIWNKQREYYPDLLTDGLKYGTLGKQEFPITPKKRIGASTALQLYGIYGLIFFQRKMYWPKSVVGQCDLTDEANPSKRCKRKRCPRAYRAAQRFRILQETNNLKVLDGKGERRLTAEEREKVVDALMTTKQQTFEALRKKLGLLDGVTFNIERGGRDKLKGHETDAAMSSSKGVGKRWKQLPDDIKDRVVEICVPEPQEDAAVRKLIDDCGLTPDEAERAAKVNLPDGYMNFCVDAIKRLIPYMEPEHGFYLMADDASNSALHAAGYLRPDQRTINAQDFLPPAPDLPNPIVRQAMIEVRKVVNAVLRELKRQGRKLDAIHIELAREAKKSAEERRKIRIDNAVREKQREKIVDRLNEEYGIKPTRANINRYLLWEEQEGDCIYCGEKISQSHLFSGEVDIDHILPRWRSLDDSMMNKVVCHRKCNDEKKDRTAREWLESTDRPATTECCNWLENWIIGSGKNYSSWTSS